MNLQETLIKYGLNEKEAKIYLALLELGVANVSDIAQKAEVIRSTAYSVLEALIRQGLVSTIEKGKIQHYLPESPQKIVALAQEKASLLEQASSQLQTLFAGIHTRPRVRYYEGLKRIEEMYNDILKMKGLKEYFIIASEETWLEMDNKFFKEFKKRRAQAQIKTKLILKYSLAALQRKKEAKKTSSEVKILPKNFPWQFTSGAYIFSNQVIFVSYKMPLAVIVESKEITDLQRATFEFMWSVL